MRSSIGCSRCLIWCIFVYLRISFAIGGAIYPLYTDDDVLESTVDWKNSVELSENENSSFRLSWKISDGKLLFLAEARTNGYLGIGFSKQGKVDIAVGWIKNEKNFLFDCHEDTENKILIKDTVQNYDLLGGYENSTHTVLFFSRPWDTCDRQHDVLLGNDTTQLIWLMGSEDPPDETLYGLRWHSKEERGAMYMYLRNSPLQVNRGLYTKQWDVTISNLSVVDGKERVTLCRAFRTPKLTTKHHIIGYEPVIEIKERNAIKRMILYECSGKHTFKIERYMKEKGFDCHPAYLPGELQSCITPTVIWAAGSTGELLPEHVGVPIGTEILYYMLEVHYESSSSQNGGNKSAGLRLHYTDRLRKHDAGVFVTGTLVSPLYFIPPFQVAYKTAGYCDKYCTNTVFPAGGVNSVSVTLHSHLAARKIKLRHFRQGEELHPIIRDDHYEFEYQQSHTLEREITVFPGDELVTECTYSTSDRLKLTQGGYSKNEEMCIAYITYYPRVNLAVCQSISPASNLFHTFGIKQFYGHDIDSIENALFKYSDQFVDKKQNSNNKSASKAVPPSMFITDDETDEKFNDATVENTVMIDNGNLLDNLVILEPAEFRDKTLKQHLQDSPWRETLFTQRVEEVFYYGKHMTFCKLRNNSLALPASTHVFPNVIVYQVPTNDNSATCVSSQSRNVFRSAAATKLSSSWMYRFLFSYYIVIVFYVLRVRL